MRAALTLVVTLAALMLHDTRADESVRLFPKSAATTHTSSTLRWVHGGDAASYGSEVVRGATVRPDATDKDYAADGTPEDQPQEEVKVTEVDEELAEDEGEAGQVLVCRARHQGDMLLGAVLSGQCVVSFSKKVTTYKRYEVLRNVEGQARLQWRHWTRFNGKPVGAVAVDGGQGGYVARRRAGPAARQTHYLGRLDLSLGLGRMAILEPAGKAGWEEMQYQDGEVLVELEPVTYELANVKFNVRRTKLKQLPRVLASTVLRREVEGEDAEPDQEVQDEEESNEALPAHHVHGPTANEATALTYSTESSSEYWGQGRGMLRGLETTVQLPEEARPRVFAWGVNSTTPGVEQAITVEAALMAGTAINVSVLANHTTSEMPYNATLVAKYRDGHTRTRVIEGIRHQVGLQGIKVEYGAHYFLHDGTLVPTTTTTSTTPPSTTAATSTSAPKAVAPANQVLEPLPEDKRRGAVRDIDYMSYESKSEAPQGLNKLAAASSASSLRVCSLAALLVFTLIPFRSGT